jgi:exosortase
LFLSGSKASIKLHHAPLLSAPRTRFALVALAWLWWKLIDHLRTEWSVNAQYGYGWGVPLLCLYLVWRRWPREQLAQIGSGLGQAARGGWLGTQFLAQKDLPGPSQAGARFCIETWSTPLMAAGWFVTLLVAEANPEWRLVAWAMAGEVIALTLWLAGCVAPGLPLRWLVFPLCFFLVAVPWPTLVEEPVVQGLSQANAAIAAGLLDLVGLPAMEHGNIVETGSGAINLDAACSGIRSLQSVLMLSLFFGEFFMLRITRRAALCLLGFVLAFGFNVARTSLLASISATKGTAAERCWHDPAGVVLLVTCFGCVWALARAGKEALGQRPEPRAVEREYSPQSTCVCRAGWAGILISLLVAEVAVECWYRSHEWRLPVPIQWNVALPCANPTFHQSRFSEQAQKLLRFDQGAAGYWRTAAGAYCQAIFLEWKPGRTAAHLASMHTPAQCLTSTGRPLQELELLEAQIHGLSLSFELYQFREAAGPVYVFYTLWRDRGETEDFQPSSSVVVNRLKAVLSGRRNCGQRSLEFAVWGMANQAQAETVLRSELDSLIRVDSKSQIMGGWR